MVDWFHLGLYLGLSPHTLEEMRVDKHGQTKECRSAVFIKWMEDTVQPSWSAIVKALVGIERKPLAQKITIKFG